MTSSEISGAARDAAGSESISDRAEVSEDGACAPPAPTQKDPLPAPDPALETPTRVEADEATALLDPATASMAAVPVATIQRPPDPKPLPDTSNAANATVVIEGDIAPARLRRPADVLRFITAVFLAAVVVGISYIASGTTSGLDSDLTLASTKIPSIVLTVTSLIGLLGVIALPVGAGISLILRHRGRQLLDAAAALLVALVLAAVLSRVIIDVGSPQLLQALTGRSVAGDVLPLNALISGLVAMITVARLIERPRWAVISVLVVAAMGLVNIVGSTLTVIGVALSLLLGWAVGLVMRYAVGTPTTRPTGLVVAQTLEHNGYPLSVLRASSLARGGRRYTATTRAGQRLDVLVLDRDLEGDGLLPVAWRSLRVREDNGGSGLTMQRRLERSALQSYAAEVAGVPEPRLLTLCKVGADASLMAFETLDAEPFASLAELLTDTDLDRAWMAVKILQDNHISHRTLSATNILRDQRGVVYLINGEEGSVAAGDVALRLDLAEMLCTLGLLTSAERSIASGLRVLGVARLSKALAVMQAVGLSPATRAAMRKRKDLMNELREGLLEANPGVPPEQIQLERLKPRTLLTVIAGTVAAYILLTQLGQVNISQLAEQADWKWVLPAVLLSAATYVGAAMSLSGFVPEKLSLIKTMLAQLAASFATLVSPPTLGAVAVNVRYLQQSSVHPALAAASVGVSQVMAFVMHLLLLLGFGILAGTQSEFDFTVPVWAMIIGGLLVAGIAASLVVPFTRTWLRKRVQPILAQVGPRLLTLTQKPTKLAEGIGGILLLNLGYCMALYACVQAFGGGGSFAAIAVVYLAGATLGQAAPTPGGLGAVEAALSAGLTAAGIEGGVAVSSVLLFRLVTFWLPTIPGWFSFNYLQKNNLL